MDKLIFTNKQIKDKILKGIDTISDPVRQTLSPRGGNVLFENDKGEHLLTNDGITIARNISVNDQIENSIINIIRSASLRTNSDAGDGTSTSILLSQVLTKEGLKLVEEGNSWIEVRDKFKAMGKSLLDRITKTKVEVKNDKDLENIATISANNDKDIATHVVEVVKIAGENGMVFIEPNARNKTELIKDLGFLIQSGISDEELAPKDGQFSLVYKDVHILLTDKKIYYEEEAQSILNTAVEAGYNSVVIVASDFMEKALNLFITNHVDGVINIMLVKKGDVLLEDLSAYIHGTIISDKRGSLVNKITKDDFTLVNSVFSDPIKTLISPRIAGSKELKARIKSIKDELKKDRDNDLLKKRLSSLTNGVVTIKVNGNTPLELREKIYRYEDAVNATSSAMKYGYLVGGGLSLLNAYNEKDYSSDIAPIAKKYCQTITRQIAENCGQHGDSVIKEVKGNYGYNALTDKYEDLLKAGVIDPYQVIKLAIDNSISVAVIIISIKYYVINDIENYEQRKDSGNSKDSRGNQEG